MAKYIDKNGNITFNSIPTSNFMQVGQLLSHPDFSGATDADLADIADENGGKLPSKVNAVEIDWNGMVLGNGQVINTTGEFAAYISNAYETAITTYYATIDQLDSKQNTIDDLETIRVGAAKGASISQATNTTYGLVRISDNYYNTQLNSYIAFSTSGAHDLYTTFNHDITAIHSVLEVLDERIINLGSRITRLEEKVAVLSKPTARLVGTIERSTTSYYNDYNLVKVKVQTNTSSWPVTVTNNNSSVALINNSYYTYNGDVSDIQTNTFTTIQLNNFDEYVTIVPSNSSAITTQPSLTFSTPENDTYAETFTTLNYSFYLNQ